jgi:replicative DNA helicase
MELSQYYNAQVAVLGSLLIEPEKLSGMIFFSAKPEYFSEAPLRNLFTAARELYMDSKPIDPVTVLDKAGQGYSKIVKDVLDATPTAANIEAYLQLLQESAKLHRLQALAEKMADATSWDEGRQLLAKASDILTDRPGRKAATYTELISDYLDRQQDNTPVKRINWGFQALNQHLLVSPGRFIILGADSSVGKTALALQLALNIARAGSKVGFFSYETSREDAADRLMANAANVNLPRTKHKWLTPDDYARVGKEGERSDRISFTVVETAGYTVDELRTEILAKRYDVVFIDYVQLIPGHASDRWQVVTEVSMALHTMAQQLNVTIIGLSQVTPPELDKKGNRRALNKSDLRESRQLMNDADVILMMDLANPQDRKGQRILNIDKNKDGPLGHIYLDFDPEHMRFTEAPPPRSETYKAIDEAVANTKREYRAQQVTFEELPDNSEPLPF